MRNDIFEMRKDAARKLEAEKLLVGRSSASPIIIEPRVWYNVTIEIHDDQMRVSFNGKPIGFLQSPGIAHDTKSSFHFTVNGPGVLFDDVHIWNAL